jgi:GGDEF domain-containing protein
VLVQQVGAPYVQFVERMQAHGMDLLAAEKLALGFDHVQLTVRLLEHWRLPAGIIQMAAGARDESLPQSVRRMSDVLNSADAMAVWLVHPRVDTLPSLQQSLRSLGSIKEGRFGGLLVSLNEKVQQLASVLSLELPAQQSAESLTLDAYRQLSAAAQEAAGDMLCPSPGIEDPEAIEATSRLRQSFALRTESREPRPIAAAPTTRSADARSTYAPAVATSLASCDADLLDELVGAMATCRQHRQPLALALVELDRSGGARWADGAAQDTAALERLRSACQQLEHEWTRCLDAGPRRLAIIFADCERQAAARLARQLLTTSGRSADPARVTSRGAASLSIGIAAIGQIPRNFPAEELLSAAERCLSGAQASGGNCVKSMDL